MPRFETELSPFRVPFRNLPSEIPLGSMSLCTLKYIEPLMSAYYLQPKCRIDQTFWHGASLQNAP